MKQRARTLTAALITGLTSLALFANNAWAAVEPEPGWGLPVDFSKEGYRIDRLIQTTTIFVSILFVITCLWMLIACIKHNKNHKAHYDHGSGRKQVWKALSISCLIFFVVDGNLLYNATIDVNTVFWNFEDAEDPNNGHLKIQINARQWSWEFHYPGADGQFDTPDDIYTVNDMPIPVDRPIVVQLAAIDVIHSFYLPNLRVKTDAVPGTINRFWFEAIRTGEVDIACAQHCGTHHYKMQGRLQIMSTEDFKAWESAASKSAEITYDEPDTHARWGWEWITGS
jgi:cytochrome c oxidase subunit 2